MSAFQSKMEAPCHGARRDGLEGTVVQTDLKNVEKLSSRAVGEKKKLL